MYVDESGDTGLVGSPTRYFVLSGIVVHETFWRQFIDALLNLRRTLRSVYGLPVRTEIHASEYISRRPIDLDRHVRLAILRNTLDELAKLSYLSITNIVVDKEGKRSSDDVFNFAWGSLFQRFENTLKAGNFPGGYRDDHGMVITDATAGRLLTRLVRRMSVYNYIPNKPQFGGGSRNAPIVRIIEDPYGKDSKDTLPIQAADVAAYFLAQKFSPNSFIRRKHATGYFDRLEPVLNKRASTVNKLGIVLI